MAAIVKRVDHVNIVVPDPRALHNFLARRLRLPVAWRFSRFGGFESGGIFAGTNLEPIRVAPSRRSPVRAASGLYGVALEPEPLAHALPELGRRKIPHSPPLVYRGTFPPGAATDIFPLAIDAGAPADLWTVVSIGGLLGNGELARQLSRPGSRGGGRFASTAGRLAGRALGSRRLGDLVASTSMPRDPYVFLCAYHAYDVERAREAATDALAADGGVLGVTGVAEIVIGARDPDAEARRWQQLLDPLKPVSEGLWTFDTGPAIRIVEAASNGPKALALGVSSIDAAASWLESQGLRDPRSAVLAVDRSATQGIDLQLVG